MTAKFEASSFRKDTGTNTTNAMSFRNTNAAFTASVLFNANTANCTNCPVTDRLTPFKAATKPFKSARNEIGFGY